MFKRLKELFRNKQRKEITPIDEWADREVKLAIQREVAAVERSGDTDGDRITDFYGRSCYESALKAYNSLMEDGHSGMSISITKNILNRLIERKPLTPIEDTDDIWNYNREHKDGDWTSYQCKRMSALFKYVYPDGTVKYSDNDRTVCYHVDDEHRIPWYNGFISRLIDEMYPITMPYIADTKYEVYRKDYLTDEKNGDYDTIHIPYIDIRNGKDVERVKCNLYFKDADKGFVEIDKEEFDERRKAHNKRVRKLRYGQIKLAKRIKEDPVHPALEEI